MDQKSYEKFVKFIRPTTEQLGSHNIERGGVLIHHEYINDDRLQG